MSQRYHRTEYADWEWRADRDQASRVPCPRCGAAEGEPCRNAITGDELRAPAHHQRITAANHREQGDQT